MINIYSLFEYIFLNFSRRNGTNDKFIFCLFPVVPDGVPAVTVDRAGLERGGPLIAECKAPPASPAPNLTWYVNDQRVSTLHYLRFYYVEPSPAALSNANMRASNAAGGMPRDFVRIQMI